MLDLSIIIPAYNAEKTIENCINSILEISGISYEIIVIDDGSCDKTKEICMSFNNVRVFSQMNAGVSTARNKGIHLALGKYIYFLDSDDLIISKYFLEFVEYAISNQLDVCSSQFCVNEKKINCFENSVMVDDTFEYDNFHIGYVWNKLYRRKFLIDNSIVFDSQLSFGEDLVFNLLVLKFDIKIGIYGKTTYCYTINDSGISRKYISNYDYFSKCAIDIRNEIIFKKPELKLTNPFYNLEYSLCKNEIRNELRRKKNGFKNNLQIIKNIICKYKKSLSSYRINSQKKFFDRILLMFLKTSNKFLIYFIFNISNKFKG